MDFSGKRITVMGLGHFGGGVGAARWLARRGAEVTVTDVADRAVLAESLAALAGEPIAAYHLGGHRAEDLQAADLVVVNPAVRPDNPFLRMAIEAGVPLASETGLFLEACPARVIGVTGTNGKSTTAAMTAAIFRADGRSVYLGGNIGRSLLDDVGRIRSDDWVVLEISSFQLHYLELHRRFPEIAVVTNCSPNHLDWHGDFRAYTADKQRLLLGQSPGTAAVLNTLDPEVAGWSRLVRGQMLPLVALDAIPPLPVPGQHNRVNAACAAAAALGAGCAEASVREGLASYRALPDRLERVAIIGGRAFYNDSSSTTPESTAAALEALNGRTWLLAGGSDKGGDFIPMCQAIAANAAGAAFFGAVRRRLRAEVVRHCPEFPCTVVETMDEALTWCWRHSQPGENIVLSPGCASHDQYRNYRERAAHFVRLLKNSLAKS